MRNQNKGYSLGDAMFPYVEIAGIKLPTFPLIILIAIFATIVIYITSSRYPTAYTSDLMKKIVPILLGTAIGARVTSAITLIPVSNNPFWYNLLFGGAVFYGGLVGGCLGLALICMKKKQPFFEYTDVVFTLFPFSHAICRFGCFLNGCCYGRAYSGIFSVLYPVDGDRIHVFPTWFLESFFCVALFIFFQYVLRTNIRGIRTAIYFIFYSVFRFFIEYARGDEIRGFWGVLSTSQIISFFTLVFGIIVLIYSCKIKAKNFMIEERE